jgi:hypothetical protein
VNLTDKQVENMRQLVEVQGSSGNWNYDEYMHGMYNGMELILSMVEGRDPNFRNKPDKFISEEASE